MTALGRIGRALLGPLLVLLTVTSFGSVAPEAAAQGGGRQVTFTGHGWGHGRGLSQYGAYGYAAGHGWSSGQILDHYYGGTSGGSAPLGGPVWPLGIRVELRYLRGGSTTVGLDDGVIVLRGMDEVELDRLPAGAVRLRWASDHFDVETAPSCGGPWSARGSIGGRTTVRFQAESSAGGSSGLLQGCGDGQTTWYQGELRAVVDGGVQHAVNVVNVEQYLRGVVPNEMPASWPAAALQAQAVAARSYALAGDSRQQPYADTCDTTLCQVYDGAYTTRGGSFRAATDSRADAAILATAGLVRLNGSGGVARTEFSSSSGGYTAGGTFPAVVDDGDDISSNRNHDWTMTVAVAPLEARHDLGRLLAVEVTERNGLGADGGRAKQVRLRFERGTATESASTVRSLLGLKSDWFVPGPVVDPDKRNTTAGSYIDRSYQHLVARPASDVEIERWHTRVSSGNRIDLTSILVRSDYFVGRMVDDLYQRALGRSADPDGRAYWVATIGRGLPLQHTGVLFFGSREYYNAAGGTDAAFVGSLYRGILGREADPGGLAYWTGEMAAGRARPDDVAAGFYQSLESRRQRALVIHEAARGVAPSEAGIELMAARLLQVDDLVVAAEVAASPEA